MTTIECNKCKRITAHEHKHDAAHGIPETHMSGSERFICCACGTETYGTDEDAGRFPFTIDRQFCGDASPVTGQLCTMTNGHAGPHKAGGPYHTVEAWVTQCAGGKCEYHENSNRLKKTEWLECIRCGHKQPII